MVSVRTEDFKEKGLVYAWVWDRGLTFWVSRNPKTGRWSGSAHPTGHYAAKVVFVRDYDSKERAILEVLRAAQAYFEEQARAITPYVNSIKLELTTD